MSALGVLVLLVGVAIAEFAVGYTIGRGHGSRERVRTARSDCDGDQSSPTTSPIIDAMKRQVRA
jgi:hypothetical protein